MLRLRKVEMFGFKSFAERTRILFNGTGIAAVVGPNGCGKSNIADAILWVLGEQSAKTLRSSRMADCIFNGTASRPPTNLAEVTLTLVDPEAEQPASPIEQTRENQPPEANTDAPEGEAAAEDLSLPGQQPGPAASRKKNRLNLKILPGEVVVTRRLYRDGTSEYYMNGELCRLRDIQELFMGTGLGPESYAIIEQGRVGQILSSRPADRRALIEEAAGVSKYKTKRRLAENKLAAARQNLLRVNDILEEITKQLNSLKRQASRARRYQELKSEGTDLRRKLLATQLERFRAAEATLAAQLEEKAREFEQTQSALAGLEQEQAAGQARQEELETSLRHEQNQAGQILVEQERAQARMADARRQQNEVTERLTTLAAEREALAGQAAATAAALEETRSTAVQLEADLAAAAGESQRLRDEAESLRGEVAGLETCVAELQEKRAVGAGRLSAARAEMAQLEQATDLTAERAQRLQGEQQAAQEALDRLAGEEADRQAALAQARAERTRTQENVAAAERELARCQQELEAEQERVEEVRRSLAGAVAQEQAMGEILSHRTAFTEPVRKLLLGQGGVASEQQFRSVGVVADFAQFEPQYAPLLEDYLHDEMEYVVVETYEEARSGVSFLRQSLAGRATFLVDSFGRVPPKLVEEASRPEGQGLIGALADFVQLNGALGAEAKRVLPKLSRTWLVESARAAEEFAREFPQYFFLSTDGTCYHGRLVSGGARNGYGAQSLQRELEQAGRRRSEIEPLAGRAEKVLRDLEAARRQREAQLDSARQELFAQEKNLLQLEQQLESLAAERARRERDLRQAEEELGSRESQQRAGSERLAALRGETTRQEGELTATDAELRAKAETLADRRRRSEDGAALLSELTARRAACEERLAAARQEQTRLEETSARLEAERRQREELEVQLRASGQHLAQDLLAFEEEVGRRQQARAEQEERCRQFDEERTALRQRLIELDAALRQRRSALESLRERRHALEVDRARQEADRQHAEVACQSELGVTAEQLCAAVAERLEGDELAQAELRYGEIKQRLDNIGPVNMMALEEFQECDERFQFLTRQREDLLASIDDTRKTIDEIDTVSRRQFDEAFRVISENFVQTFKTLFGGGNATLRITESDEKNEPGIDLIVQPPGKRLQNVLLLSGGEKALAALALLIAVFRYQPSPFCILDEVDAPLDDTNVGRFTDLVREMAPQTQFILVTHNKKTMEVAPILYGVTMQGAVSQIVSVRFDEQPAPAA